MTIKAILTDIEGTTSAVSFVFDVLFPYAARHLPDLVREHAGEPEVAAQLAAVRAESGEADADVERRSRSSCNGSPRTARRRR